LARIGKLFIYLLGVIVLGALLAPPLFWLAGAFEGQAGFLEEIEFQKVFNRAMLVAAFVLLLPIARWLDIRSMRELGLEPNHRWWQHLTLGFCAAFGLLLVLGIILLELEIFRLKSEPPWASLLKIGGTAAAVSLIEEFLFRGALLGIFRRAIGNTGALIIVSAIFSIVHFLKPHDTQPAHVSWLSGFTLIPKVFWQFGEPMLVLAGFTTLFCVGLVLGYATVRTRSLFLPIGLHAGWVFGEMGFSKLTKRINRDTLPWFGQDLTAGIASVIVVLLTGALVWWWLNYVDLQYRSGRG
jgi:membrane protease YdiL (CAAX protease family)